MERYHISGVPITADGKLVGILTNRDIRFRTDMDQPVGELMTSDGLITVPLGTTLLGTFSRARAVDEETLDFFSSGHPLVEGVLAELEEGPRGRVGLLQIPGDEETFGLLAIYRDAADWRAVAVDAKGQPRPDLATLLTAGEFETEPIEAKKWTSQASWKKAIRRMAEGLPKEEKPQTLAAFRVRRR